MLRIHKEQFASFHEPLRRAFEDEMVNHLALFSPSLFKAIGQVPMRKIVESGTRAAASYGFDRRGAVRLYLELMLLFGSRFDTDPQYPWFREILTQQGDQPQMWRANRLYERTKDFRQRVLGPGDAFLLDALRALCRFMQRPLLLSPNNLVSALAIEVSSIFPQKAAYVGENALTSLLREGIETARRYRSPSLRGEVLMVALMFALGHGCIVDPLYPWIAQTLDDPEQLDPPSWPSRLEAKALTQLESVMAGLGKEQST